MIYNNEQKYKAYLGTRKMLFIISEKTGIPINELELPCIYIYYYNPKPYNDESVVIPMYFSDFYQSEYNLDNYSARFKLRYELDGVVNYVEDLPAGDYTLELGVLSEGTHWYSLQVEDSEGRLSRRIYNEILVVDRETYNITDEQTHTITDQELIDYSINKNNSESENDMINNRVGLTNLFADLQSQGYRKVILPVGIYRINRCIPTGTVENTDCPIIIPTNLTVDLNKSTIKLHPYDDREYGEVAHVSNLMIKMVDCYDSHLVNGILEGDFFERRDELVWGDGTNAIQNSNGEFNHTFLTYGGEFCSLDNITIKQTTGYNCGTLQNESHGKLQSISSWTENTTILNGIEVEKQGFVTSSMILIGNELLASKYIVASVWLAMGGLKGKYWDLDFSFYDDSQNFIDTIKVYQYTRCRIPEGAKYCKLTLKGTASDMGGLVIHHMKVPRYFSCNNCHWIDNRTCANPAQTQFFAFLSCDFTRSGQSITPCEIDFEDGWEQQQDIFVKGCKIVENTGTADVIDCAGINHVYEDNENMNFTIRYSCNGVVIRNNKNSGIKLTIGWKTGNTIRVYNNEINTMFSLGQTDTIFFGDDKIKLKIRENSMALSSVNCASSFYVIENNDIEITGYTTNFHIKNCNVTMSSNSAYMNNNIHMDRCIFRIGGELSQMKFSFNQLNADRQFICCTYEDKVIFASHNYFNSGYWKRCLFKNAVTVDIYTTMENEMGAIQFNNCTFKDDVILIIKSSNCYIQFNNCTFEKKPVFMYKGEANTEFNNCTIPE